MARYPSESSVQVPGLEIQGSLTCHWEGMADVFVYQSMWRGSDRSFKIVFLDEFLKCALFQILHKM